MFSVINAVLNPSVNCIPNPSNELCESFLSFFSDKIANLRPQVVTTYNDPDLGDVSQPLALWETFDPISLQSLTEIIFTLKTSFCPHDVIHPWYFKLLIESVGFAFPAEQMFINWFCSCMPEIGLCYSFAQKAFLRHV